jgi:N-acetylglutamate synthase-like GNAT family acetyltransferase
MAIQIQQSSSNVDWNTISEILKRTGMAYFAPETHKKIYEASYAIAFAYDGDRLIGCGRALSDGIYQAALYDVAVLPEYQDKGVGRSLVEAILARIGQCNVILYASPGKEGFYQKLGFRAMKTGMAKFVRAEIMAQKGFTEE